jgi:ElaB/YqjD/DUF883 family membrane-anchored ribosome-binding protein
MTTTDQIRTVIRDLEAKARQLEIDKKLVTFADQADHYLRAAAARAGEYAAENRGRVEATLDKAGSKVDEKTDGKYHAYVGKVRAGVLTGVDWVAEQSAAAETTTAGAPASGPSTAAGTDPAEGSDTTAAPTMASTDTDVASAPTTSVPGDAADVTPAGSADSDAWVDVTDDPPGAAGPGAEGSADPR